MVSKDRILAEVRGIPLIFLSPRSNHQAQLANLFIESGRSVWTYTLTDQDRVPAQFVNHFLSLSAGHLTGIGSQAARLTSRADVAELATALASDLSSTGLNMLLLDEFDRVIDSQDFETFLKALVAKLPSHLQLIIKTRELPYDRWSALLDAGSAVILEEDPISGTVQRFQPNLPYLEVQAFGHGQVAFNGRPINDWDGPLVKHLFFYFVDHPMVTRDEIFATFWTDLSIRDATNVFHVTKRKISEKLGFELTDYRSGFYCHSQRLTIDYDVSAFEDAIKQANSLKEPANVTLLQKALHWYRSDFLYSWTPSWIINRRNELQSSYIEALIRIGTRFKESSDYQQALYHYQLALTKIPYREDVYRLIMEVYSSLGRYDLALSQYQQLVDTLQASFRITPSKESRRLYQQISERADR